MMGVFSLTGCADDSKTEAQDPGDALDRKTKEIVSALNREQKVAGLFVVEPEALQGVSTLHLTAEDATDSGAAAGAITSVTENYRKVLKACPVAGLALFSKNLVSSEQASTFLHDLTQAAKNNAMLPLFLAVDEEGGTVARIANNSAFDTENVGNMADIGATENEDAARAAAHTIGSYLKALGFNLDFAPVCDIADTPGSPMKKRAFGNNAQLVANMVSAQVEGFHEAGMLCCAKHFPGIGSAETDSHTDAISTSRNVAQMEKSELIPFQSAIDAGVDFVMMGHLNAPVITDNEEPASLSRPIVNDLLREQLGFKGPVITDSLQMQSITKLYSADEAAVRAIEAGCDLVLMPIDFKKAYDGVLNAVKSGRLSEERIDESLMRITKLKLSKLV